MVIPPEPRPIARLTSVSRLFLLEDFLSHVPKSCTFSWWPKPIQAADRPPDFLFSLLPTVYESASLYPFTKATLMFSFGPGLLWVSRGTYVAPAEHSLRPYQTRIRIFTDSNLGQVVTSAGFLNSWNLPLPYTNRRAEFSRTKGRRENRR